MTTGALSGELLAKQPAADGRRVTLLQHSLDVETAAVVLLGPRSRWGRAMRRFFRIRGEEHDRWLLHLRVAALLHDLGKANADFQAAVRHERVEPQTLRHEHLGALILHLPAVRDWLRECRGLDVPVVTAAILSHHLKADGGGEWRWGQPASLGASVELLLGHPDVATLLSRVAELVEAAPPPAMGRLEWRDDAAWGRVRAEGVDAAKEIKRAVRRDPERLALLAGVKAGLIVADAAGSGLVRERHPISDWCEDVANGPPVTPEEIATAVVEPRVEQIERSSGRAFEYHQFQRGAAVLGPRSLMLAPCGSGKTIAAWKWAESQARAHQIGKVIFLYPTRATATEGFRDYVAWAPEGEGTLLSGTARYELEAMSANPSEAMRGKRLTVDEAQERLFALGFWRYRFFSSTVDQFLSFLEHDYRGLCLVPVLADAAVIVDEVHSFDAHLFENLIAFLKTFDVPVLCMTATLPPDRRQKLIEVGLSSYPRAEDMASLHDLEEAERRPRYRIEIATAESARACAVDGWRCGRRVLWVVNQVGRAQRLCGELGEQLGTPPTCYHSAFKLVDRQARHASTVAAFKARERAIAVTTQVCEMSLDLDADILLTELAPVTSLVQRMGRANRHASLPDDGSRARVIVVEPESALPYTREELSAARGFLGELVGSGEVSQRDLAEALERHAPGEALAEGSARFLEGGYFATPGSLRDVDERHATAVLDGDLDRVEGLWRAKRPYDGFLLPVPHRLLKARDTRPAWLPRHLSVAPSERYSTDLGFLVQEAQHS